MIQAQVLIGTPGRSSTSDKQMQVDKRQVLTQVECRMLKLVADYPRSRGISITSPSTLAGISGHPVTAQTDATSMHPAEDSHLSGTGFLSRQSRQRQAGFSHSSFHLIARFSLTNRSDNSGVRYILLPSQQVRHALADLAISFPSVVIQCGPTYQVSASASTCAGISASLF